MQFSLNNILLICVCLVYVGEATVVRPCPGGKKLDSSEVTISNCAKGVCKLRKGTLVTITMKVRPTTDIKKLRTAVSANIAGLDLPFFGVDGTSACENMYLEDGKTKTNCPLKANTNYVYKNKFDVFSIYPSTSLKVHWALTQRDGDLACFEIPARIL